MSRARLVRVVAQLHAVVLAGLCIAVIIVSCGKKNPAAVAPSEPQPDAVYVVRGKVIELPDPNNPTTEFRVHHERIPDFKTSEGKVVGMNVMIMPFPVSDPKLLDGVSVGDVVEITFADWYKPMRTYKVTKLTKLPPDTELNLGK